MTKYCCSYFKPKDSHWGHCSNPNMVIKWCRLRTNNMTKPPEKLLAYILNNKLSGIKTPCDTLLTQLGATR